jgi:hypothetical protein
MLRPKQEAFAQALAKSVRNGMSVADCYLSSGYRCHDRHSAETAGSRLSKNVEIQARVNEIVRPAVKRAGLSLEQLVVETEAVLRGAKEDRAFGACVSALGLLARIHEMVREQGMADAVQYGGAKWSEEILQLVRDLIGDGPAAVVAAAITSDVYSKDIDKALELIDGIRADLLARRSAKAIVVS